MLNDQTVLFQLIQFSLSHLFEFSLNVKVKFKSQIVLFDPKIGPYQVWELRLRVDLEAVEMKGHLAFPKAPVLVELNHQII